MSSHSSDEHGALLSQEALLRGAKPVAGRTNTSAMASQHPRYHVYWFLKKGGHIEVESLAPGDPGR